MLYLLILSISINNLSAFSFKSLIPSNVKAFCSSFSTELYQGFYEGVNEEGCKLFGNEEASEQYKEKIYEFLSYLGIENVHNIPIRKLKKEGSFLLPALTTVAGIWLNEETIFSGELDSYQLYILAHEAAHYTCHHPIKYFIFKKLAQFLPTNLIQTLVIFYSYRKAINNQNIYNLVLMSVITNMYLKIIKNITIKTITPFINNTCVKSNEKQADLKAAEMLCEHGYEYVIEDMINRIKNNIEQGITVLNYHDHPSFEEQLAYFQKFWDEWQQKNEKAVRG